MTMDLPFPTMDSNILSLANVRQPKSPLAFDRAVNTSLSTPGRLHPHRLVHIDKMAVASLLTALHSHGRSTYPAKPS